MSSTNNNVWKYLVAGGAAIVAGAVICNYLMSNDSDSGINKCLEDIDALGPVKKENNGILAFNYYKDMFTVVGKHGRLRFAEEKRDMVLKRRKALKEGDHKLYADIVKEIITREENQMGDIMQEVMEHLGISEQEFMMT